jgi:peptidoglycan/xylan/chitin deacetylase (PgdA/CDA1 family)
VTGVVLTYHAVEDGPQPLCVDPKLFEEHLDVLGEAGATTLTVSELGDALRAGAMPERAVAITFDDGIESVVRTAVPLLRERDMKATLFCVAGHLGGSGDWTTQPRWRPAFRLASAEQLAAVAGDRIEIGSHGVEHVPLHAAGADVVQRELTTSRQLLESEIGEPVRSFAFPYGTRPRDADQALAAAGYSVACAGGLALVDERSNPLALPRVDVHYVRRPVLLRRLVSGSLPFYLGLRRAGARARRVLVDDFAAPAA